MKRFLLILAVITLATYLVVSFCVWSFTWMAECHAVLRIFFTTFCLGTTCLADNIDN